MALFRSEAMGYFSIIMPREYAWETLNEIGGLDALQFVDLNSDQHAFSKPYSNYLKRCDEMEAKLHIIEKEMIHFKKEVIDCQHLEVYLQDLKRLLQERNKAEWTYFDEVEAEIGEKLKGLSEQMKIRETLIERFDDLVEYRQVLLRTFSFLGGAGDVVHDLSQASDMGDEDEEEKRNHRSNENIRFSYLAGVINQEDSLRFKRMLFRVTKGMAWTTLMDIEKPRNEMEKKDYDYFMNTQLGAKQKTVFFIVYQGGAHEMMAKKLNKLCESFEASKYSLPLDKMGHDKKLREIELQLSEAKKVVLITESHIESILEQFSKPRRQNIGYSLITEYKMFILKEKIIYDNLNKLKSQNTLYKGNCWCPLKKVQIVHETILDLKKRKGNISVCEFQETQKPHDLKPPTYFETNEATWVFQEIVNTYGVPRYQEINPGIFTIATFPFLFGVMFGDIGHGLLLLLAGIYLCLFKLSIEQDKTSLWRVLLPGRYILLLQGFFAFYCGLIYNDFMSLPFNIFGTCYDIQEGGVSKKLSDCTYPFGIDPAWSGASNELAFINSFKMKISIILGVTHMLFGLLLRGWNNIHFKNWVDFFCEFVPMFIFLSLTFGYMVILIFVKWAIPWGTDEFLISEAPSIISIFIKMVLKPGEWDAENGIPLYGKNSDGKYQAETQVSFLIIVAICAVIILIPKPLILWYKHKKAASYGLVSSDHEKSGNKNLLHPQEQEFYDHIEEHKENSPDNKLLEDHSGGANSSFSNPHIEFEHFDFGEVFVHQSIEAIEFILGSISNTASYLRLWALSLAHSQLAKVFFDNCLKGPIQDGNIFGLVFGFYFFAQFTFGILLLMDQLECFLHALRLHWVEFQNKFYKADGYLFQPFSFKMILDLTKAQSE